MGRYQHPPTARGYQVHEVISALQKSIRRSDIEHAVYWAVELHQSGHAGWCWNRLKVIAVEDVCPTEGVSPEIATLEGWGRGSRDGGGGMELVSAVIRLASARKSRAACWGLIRAGSDHHERLGIPDEALDRHTRRGLQMGRRHDHFFDEAQKLVDLEDPVGEVLAFEQDCERHARALRVALDAGDMSPMPDNPIKRPEPTAKQGAKGPAADTTWIPPALKPEDSQVSFDMETGEVADDA